MSTATGMTPEAMRRLQNLARFWNERLRSVSTDAELAQVCFERAKAAARRAQRGGDTRAMHELAELLSTWAAQREQAEAVHQGRHTP